VLTVRAVPLQTRNSKQNFAAAILKNATATQQKFMAGLAAECALTADFRQAGSQDKKN